MTRPPRTAQLVKAHLLHSGRDTALGVKRASGLSHEALYQALVWLEARGIATLECCQPDHNGPRTVYWSVE